MNDTIKEDNDDYSRLFAEEIIQNINTNKRASTILKTDQKVLARITDGIYRQTSSALRELICNAYDADAENVYIETDVPRFDRISDYFITLPVCNSAVIRLFSKIGNG